jgi:predicted negative regulator of RcsB-dependent stress response
MVRPGGVLVNVVIAESIAVLALVALSGVAGYSYRGEVDHEAMALASSNVDVCKSTAEAKAAAVTLLQAKFDDLSTRHEKALADAESAMDVRDQEIERLSTIAVARATTLRKASHDDADCAQLADLALCPAVADQLWPMAPQGARAAPHTP